MSLNDIQESEKPREKLMLKSIHSLSNAELLALLLCIGKQQKNALQLAYDVLSKFSLEELSCASIKELTSISGIGIAKASRILSAFEITKRIKKQKIDEKKYINGVDDAVCILETYLLDQTQEMLVGIFLDARSKILCVRTIFIGTLTESVVHPRDILKIAIEVGAAAFIIGHNHPSGDPTPSDDDISTTQKISSCGEIFDIWMLDHIIIGSDGYYSFRESAS